MLNIIKYLKEDKVITLKKGKSAWNSNLDITHPYYKCNNKNICEVTKALIDIDYNVIFRQAVSFTSTNGHIDVQEMYSAETDGGLYFMLAWKYADKGKVVVTPCRRPLEAVNMGYDYNNISYVPVIVTRKDNAVNGINII